MGLPRIAVLAMGGTIAAAGASATQTAVYEIADGVEDLLSAVPALAAVAEVRGEQVANLPSHELDIPTLLRLARRVDALLSGGDVDGIVVTHGTDTLEETAYFLNLTVKSEKPVVVVGAARPATALSADGPLNLFNAVRLAGFEGARGEGVLVLMNDRIGAARFATKAHTSAPDGLRSPEQGCLGVITGDRIGLYASSRRKHTLATPFDLSGLDELPPVEIVYAYLGMDARPIDAALAAGIRGIVLAASGNGSLPETIKRAAERCREHGAILVRSSRVGSGVVSPKPFDAALGTVSGDSLNPQKARILLMLALTVAKDREAIQRLFDEH